MTTLYGIFVHDYSNSYVESVAFTKLEDAEAYSRAHEDGGSIVEYELDPPLTEVELAARRDGVREYRVSMDYSSGNAASAIQEVVPKGLEEKAALRNGRFSIWVWARDEEHAIKVANEKRGRFLAEGTLKEEESFRVRLRVKQIGRLTQTQDAPDADR